MKKIKENNFPIGKVKIVDDFLPPPEALFPNENLIKITIAVDEKTLAQFKKVAQKTGHKYQRMMREVLRVYAENIALSPLILSQAQEDVFQKSRDFVW